MARLRRSQCSAPGITRRRAGKGWAYYGPDGRRITDPATRSRLDALVLPPAWSQVWICPWPNGHIQAIGTDAAGRRQYRYHEAWTATRSAAKFDRVLTFAEELPALRQRVSVELERPGLSRARVLAAAVRLLDLGFFRVGGEEYAETNGTYGLATLLREHVTVDGDAVTFDYIAKSGKQRVRELVEPHVRDVIAELLARDDPQPALLAWQDPSPGCPPWHDVTSSDINDHLRELTGLEVSAKDFRTWSATVLCAVALAVSTPTITSESARKRAISRAVAETAHYLGNTPAVCRASYIHPKIIDLFSDGITVAPALPALGESTPAGQLGTQGPLEEAVLAMLRNPQAARRSLRAAGAATGRPARRSAAPRSGERATTPIAS